MQCKKTVIFAPRFSSMNYFSMVWLQQHWLGRWHALEINFFSLSRRERKTILSKEKRSYIVCRVLVSLSLSMLWGQGYKVPDRVYFTAGCSDFGLLLDNALQRKSPLCNPFLGIARPQPQFQHSCVSEQFI
jgi:hypothetical protein